MKEAKKKKKGIKYDTTDSEQVEEREKVFQERWIEKDKSGFVTRSGNNPS
jgi:hypothetical protein